jgi:hypothetical protein
VVTLVKIQLSPLTQPDWIMTKKVNWNKLKNQIIDFLNQEDALWEDQEKF